jgi:hypothetical protein
MGFDVDVGVVRDVEHDLLDVAAGGLELGLVYRRDGVTAVVADAESGVAEHGADLVRQSGWVLR